jgi:MFS family permease
MLQPGSRSYIRAIVVAQMLAQIGAFALPALLPTYLARWHLSATEAGWLVGVFLAAYVVSVPVLLALTDRMPVKRIYLLGAGLTTLSHLGFALIADDFWLGLMLRALAGIGWAGTYMTGAEGAGRQSGRNRAIASGFLACGRRRNLGCRVVRHRGIDGGGEWSRGCIRARFRDRRIRLCGRRSDHAEQVGSQ